MDIETSEMDRLTRRNDEWINALQVSVPERIEFTSTDGLRIQGWLLQPARQDSSAKTPLILQIHGGPHAMYTGTFSYEIQTLAAQGYAVLWVNPRGSMGYGQEFARACRGDFAGGDFRDLMEAVDHALNTYEQLDESRLGVAGGSYGGVMTNWIVAHSNRFKAAVTQRCISNWLSMYGTSDIGISYVEGVIGVIRQQMPSCYGPVHRWLTRTRLTRLFLSCMESRTIGPRLPRRRSFIPRSNGTAKQPN